MRGFVGFIGGNVMGDSSANLQALAENAKVIEGKRFVRIK